MPLRRDPLLDRFEPLRKLNANRALGYGVAVASVGVAVLIRYAAGTSMAPGPLIQFYLAIIVSTVVGRVRAGVLATALSLLAAIYFLFLAGGPTTLTPGASFAVLVLYAVGFAAIVAVIGTLFDLLDRLHGEEDKLRLILDIEPMGILTFDTAGTITLANPAVEKLFGYGSGELIGKRIELLVPDDLNASHTENRANSAHEPAVRIMGAGRQLEGQRRDGGRVAVEIGLNPVEREGRKGTLATIVDVTERRLAEKKQEVLLHEVQHRARNVLQVLQVVAQRIFISERPVRESLERFIGVVNALARTQDLLGSDYGANLGQIVEAELAAFPAQSNISGRPLMLSRHAAQEISLIVHELAINATKHGALSVAGGRVEVGWSEEGNTVVFVWKESGGPQIATPARRGFGRVVLEDLAKDLGQVSLSYEGGFRYELKAPLSRILDQRLERVA